MAGLEVGGGVMVLWRILMVVVFLEKVKGMFEILVELLEFVVVYMEKEEEEDEGKELEKL